MSDQKANNLEEQILDLIKQATTERSHYYVASVLTSCLHAITKQDLEIKARDIRIQELTDALLFIGDNSLSEVADDKVSEVLEGTEFTYKDRVKELKESLFIALKSAKHFQEGLEHAEEEVKRLKQILTEDRT